MGGGGGWMMEGNKLETCARGMRRKGVGDKKAMVHANTHFPKE